MVVKVFHRQFVIHEATPGRRTSAVKSRTVLSFVLPSEYFQSLTVKLHLGFGKN